MKNKALKSVEDAPLVLLDRDANHGYSPKLCTYKKSGQVLVTGDKNKVSEKFIKSRPVTHVLLNGRLTLQQP